MLKRTMDVVAAAAGLILLSPVMAIVALAVKRSSAGAILYLSPRVGQGGRPFDLLKFRTMRADADSIGSLVTAGSDDRITPVGRYLRRTKLDELPSLWNVLRGEMSLVGPRPENPRSAALYSDEQRRVLDLRPGITSLATLKYRHEEQLLAGASDLDAAYFVILQDKLAIELEYLRHRSLWLDLQILIRTVLAVFR